MIRTIDYHGLKAVEFSKGDYVAVVVPEVGANLIRLANTRLGIEILHTPSAEEVENFRTRPQIYCLPLLFLPTASATAAIPSRGAPINTRSPSPRRTTTITASLRANPSRSPRHTRMMKRW